MWTKIKFDKEEKRSISLFISEENQFILLEYAALDPWEQPATPCALIASCSNINCHIAAHTRLSRLRSTDVSPTTVPKVLVYADNFPSMSWDLLWRTRQAAPVSTRQAGAPNVIVGVYTVPEHCTRRHILQSSWYMPPAYCAQVVHVHSCVINVMVSSLLSVTQQKEGRR